MAMCMRPHSSISVISSSGSTLFLNTDYVYMLPIFGLWSG